MHTYATLTPFHQPIIDSHINVDTPQINWANASLSPPGITRESRLTGERRGNKAIGWRTILPRGTSSQQRFARVPLCRFIFRSVRAIAFYIVMHVQFPQCYVLTKLLTHEQISLLFCAATRVTCPARSLSYTNTIAPKVWDYDSLNSNDLTVTGSFTIPG